MGRHRMLIRKGYKYGRLTIIKEVEPDIYRDRKLRKFLCQCDCGNKVEVRLERLRSGSTQSCGCTRYGKMDILGKRFGRLTVVKYNNETCRYTCQCDCGNMKDVLYGDLVNGRVSSCGCYRRESSKNRNRKYVNDYPVELVSTELFDIWTDMKKNRIPLCRKWDDNFIPFYMWAKGNEYSKGNKLERIDENKEYSPSNCKWV